jgi:hypothetical protein
VQDGLESTDNEDSVQLIQFLKLRGKIMLKLVKEDAENRIKMCDLQAGQLAVTSEGEIVSPSGSEGEKQFIIVGQTGCGPGGRNNSYSHICTRLVRVLKPGETLVVG